MLKSSHVSYASLLRVPLKLLQSFQHIFWGFEGAVVHARRCNSRKNTRVSRGIDTMCKKSVCTCTQCQASPSFFCKKSTCFSPTFLLFSFFIEKKSILVSQRNAYKETYPRFRIVVKLDIFGVQCYLAVWKQLFQLGFDIHKITCIGKR